MAGINEFLIFDENNQNTMTNQAYSTDDQRLNGVSTGIARSALYNKTMRQSSVMVNAIAKYLSEKGYDVKEDDSELYKLFSNVISPVGMGVGDVLYLDETEETEYDWEYVNECNPTKGFFLNSTYNMNATSGKYSAYNIKSKNNVIVITNKGKLEVSNNNGVSFTEKYDSDGKDICVLYDEIKEYFYLITCNANFLKSTNGTTWSVSATSPSYSSSATIISAFAGNGCIVYSSNRSSLGDGQAYLSTDNGVTFNAMTGTANYYGNYRNALGFFYSNVNKKWYNFFDISTEGIRGEQTDSGYYVRLYYSDTISYSEDKFGTNYIELLSGVRCPVFCMFDIKPIDSNKEATYVLLCNGRIFKIKSDNTFEEISSDIFMNNKTVMPGRVNTSSSAIRATLSYNKVLLDNKEYIQMFNNLYYIENNTFKQVGYSNYNITQYPYYGLNNVLCIPFYFNDSQNNLCCIFYGSVFKLVKKNKEIIKVFESNKEMSNSGELLTYENIIASVSNKEGTIVCNGAPIIGFNYEYNSTVYTNNFIYLYVLGVLGNINSSSSNKNSFFVFSGNKLMYIDIYGINSEESNVDFKLSLIELKK